MLSPEQKLAFSKFVRGENLFITGPGGTGKTKLIHHFIQHAETNHFNYQVCAMTGCAAILLGCKARTLHSWSGIKLAKGPKEQVIASTLKNRNVRKSIKAAKLLIVDEVSMMSQKIFEIIDALCRDIRNRPFSAFGGIQVVFTGDFFQLPPVGSYDEPETTNMCFESPLWNTVFPLENTIELQTIFRQTDPVYIDILSQVRRGSLNDEHIQLLSQYVRREYNPDNHFGCVPTKLFALRNKAEHINNQMFSKIDQACYESPYTTCITNLKYLDTNTPIPYEVLKTCRDLSESDIQREMDILVKSIQAEEIFQYKVGALVMCTKNIDLEMGICNGSHGTIIDVVKGSGTSPPIPIVQFVNGVKLPMQPVGWQSELYPILSVHQIPLRLAWALTIHKIQGATMDMAEMDIGHTVFEYGQIYVALSRIKSLDGLYLLNFRPEKIKANPKVVAFYDRIAQAQIAREPHTPATTTTASATTASATTASATTASASASTTTASASASTTTTTKNISMKSTSNSLFEEYSYKNEDSNIKICRLP